jgi:hypothetical protein
MWFLVVLQLALSAIQLPPEWGPVSLHAMVETDGQSDTVEAVVWSLSDFRYRVVQLRPNGALCAGPWFYWAGEVFATPVYRLVNGISRAVVDFPGSWVVEFELLTPACP